MLDVTWNMTRWQLHDNTWTSDIRSNNRMIIHVYSTLPKMSRNDFCGTYLILLFFYSSIPFVNNSSKPSGYVCGFPIQWFPLWTRIFHFVSRFVLIEAPVSPCKWNQSWHTPSQYPILYSNSNPPPPPPNGSRLQLYISVHVSFNCQRWQNLALRDLA